ncbi:MAG: glycosyltransferase family 39 protein [Chloroflexota bacterium]
MKAKQENHSLKSILEKRFPEILLAVLLASAVYLNIRWQAVDLGLGYDVDNDAKQYLIQTLMGMDRMQVEGWRYFISADSLTALSLKGRPPLYQFLSMAFIAIFGRSMDAAVGVNLLFQVLLMVSVYKIGKTTRNPTAGLLAALMVAAYPPLIRLSHSFRPYFAMTACVAYSLWRLVALTKSRAVRDVWLFALAMVFGVLIHPKIVGVMVFPTLAFTVYVLFLQPNPHEPDRSQGFFKWLKVKLSSRLIWAGFLPAGILSLALLSIWYLNQGLSLLNTLQTVTSDELADFRGFEFFVRGRKDTAPIFFYLRTFPSAISNVFSAIFGIGLVVGFARRKVVTVILGLSFTGAYFLFANYPSLAWLNFQPVLPIVALVSSDWLSSLENRRAATFLISLTAATAVLVYAITSWTLGPWSIPVARALASPISEAGRCLVNDHIFCPVLPTEADWHARELIEMIAEDQDCAKGCDVLVVTRGDFDSRYLSVLFLTTFADVTLPPIRLSRMIPNVFVIAPYDFEALLKSRYIVYCAPPRANSLRAYNIATENFLANPPQSFKNTHRKIATYQVGNDLKLYVLKRYKPLSVSEAEDAIQNMPVDEKYKYQQYQVLAPLFARAGRLEDALAAYRKATEYTPDVPRLYFELAGVYEALGQLDRAAEAYRQVVHLGPRSGLAAQAQAWLDAHPR